jgi:hypothetical protein
MPCGQQTSALRERGLHDLGVVVEQRGRAGVVDQVRDLIGQGAVAHGDHERAHACHAVPHREELGSIVQHHRHPVAGAHTGVGQRVRDAVGVGVELAEGDASVAGDERDAPRIILRDAVDTSGFHRREPTVWRGIDPLWTIKDDDERSGRWTTCGHDRTR